MDSDAAVGIMRILCKVYAFSLTLATRGNIVIVDHKWGVKSYKKEINTVKKCVRSPLVSS